MGYDPDEGRFNFNKQDTPVYQTRSVFFLHPKTHFMTFS
jgi:hypothetical protein